MTNAELIKALRRCSYTTVADAEREDGYCKPCAYFAEDTPDITCIDRMMIDAADALEAAEQRIEQLEKQEPTEKQVVDYCHKRCLVIVEEELFHRMKSTFSQLPKEGEWIPIIHASIKGVETVNCSNCGATGHLIFNYCPNCGARMKGEQND